MHIVTLLFITISILLSTSFSMAGEDDGAHSEVARFHNVRIPILDFEDVTISQVLEIIEQRHRELKPMISFPPDDKGLSFIVDESVKNTKIQSYKARNIDLVTCLKQIAELCNLDIYQTSESLLFLPEGTKPSKNIKVVKPLRTTSTKPTKN